MWGQPMNVVRGQPDPNNPLNAQMTAVRAADKPFKDALNAMYLSKNKDNEYAANDPQLRLNGNLPNQSWSSPETQALQAKMQSLKGAGKAEADRLGMKTMTSAEAANNFDTQTPAQRGIAPYGSGGVGGFGSGGIGSNPFGGGLAANTMQPRSVATQIANRPAYQRNRVTTGQMSEMDRANQDRFRAETKPLTTAFNRSLSQAGAQQQMADTSVNDAAANQFFGLMNGYQQQQNSLNQQQLMPLLSQLFGGF